MHHHAIRAGSADPKGNGAVDTTRNNITAETLSGRKRSGMVQHIPSWDPLGSVATYRSSRNKACPNECGIAPPNT
jgi:hypothetical protein